MTAANNDVPRSAPLAGVRVLEWSGSIAGGYAGRSLRDAGARVVRVGDPSPGALASYLHSGKESAGGTVDDLPRLATEIDADIVLVELSDAPGAALRGVFGDRVVVFVTPWGLDGLWAGTGRPWSEFTLQVESGSLSIRGLPDGDPLATGSAEAFWIAGAMAAGAAVAALQGGPDGRVLDVPLLDVSGYATNLFIDVMAAVHGMPHEPFVPRRRLTPSVEPAGDGWVGFNLASVQNLEDFLVLIERPDYLADEEMKTHEGRYRRAAELTEAVRAWTRRHTVAEIVERAAAFRIPCAPVHNGETILGDPQTVARGFYPEHPGGGFREPAPPFLFDGERPVRTTTAAPAGERPDRGTDRPAPFAGLRVLDLGTWWVGAYVGSALGAFGADVIKVESTRRIDGSRTMGGLPLTRDHWWECSNFYLGANGNKRGVTLDLSQPDGVALLRELITTADVLIENYAPRVLESVGLDWAAVHALNPRLVMHRMPAFGLTGPRRAMVGYAQTVEQFSGLAWRTGYPDGGDPTNPSGPADPMGAANSFFALAAALYRSRRTGIGTLVESPLAEAALVMTAEQVIAWTGESVLLVAEGNRGSDPHLQGIFRARGTDRWVGISVLDDAQWRALAETTGLRHWTADPALADRSGRRAHAAALEKELGDWIAGHDADEVVGTLLAAGVPAARLTDARFLHEHPQLAARGAYETTETPYAGTLALPTLPFRRVDQPRWMRRRPPTLGEHNTEVLGGELGLSAQRLAELEQAGVIGTKPAGF